MHSIQFNRDVQKAVGILLDTYPIAREIVNDIVKNGGRCYLVGGAVRDLILGLGVKDLDIEIHGLGASEVEKILAHYGPVSLVGKVFGVFRLHGVDIDWSLPRIDMAGRKPDVIIDTDLTIEEALARRDLTMNAMAIDLSSYKLIDPFGGLNDIKNNVLRTPDPSRFIEDPLRFYRVMQFISRFEMNPDNELDTICKGMDLRIVSVERIEDEFRKMMLKSCRPSLGLRWIKSIGRLKELFPELDALVDLPQKSRWHPEYDAFEHTMQTVDAAARFKYNSDEEKWILLLAALCHDLGKATTTELVEGEWRSLGHCQAGVAPTKRFLKRIMRNKEVIDAVTKMVRYHLQPTQFIENGAKLSAYKRLARKLAPDATLEMLAFLALADQQGRNPDGSIPLDIQDECVDQFLKKAREAQVLHEVEKPVLQGRDVIDVVSPGPEMGKLLKLAYELQIEEGIKDKDELKRRVLAKP